MPFEGCSRAGRAENRLTEAARLVLEVVPGERPFLPDFGCRVHGLSTLESTEMRHLGATLIEEAVGRWAPQLRVSRAEILKLAEGRLTVRLRARGVWHELEITHRLRRFRELEGDGSDTEELVEPDADSSRHEGLQGTRETT